jgi:hypothetical protein
VSGKLEGKKSIGKSGCRTEDGMEIDTNLISKTTRLSDSAE